MKNAPFKIAAAAATAGLALGAAVSAHGQNLYVNGSGEDNNFTGYSAHPQVFLIGGGVDADNEQFVSGCVGPQCLIPGDPQSSSLDQTIFLPANHTIEFMVSLKAFATSQFDQWAGSQKILSVTNTPTTFTTYDVTFNSGAGGTTNFASFFRDDASAIFSDDYRTYDLGAAGPSPSIPEPNAWALMIAGFGLAGAALRHRRALSLS